MKIKGRSARRGNSPSPYHKRGKRPYPYPWQTRTADGNLRTKANDSDRNKYP